MTRSPCWRKTMLIDGQCHCGRVTYEAEIDPDQVSMTGSPAKIYSKTGDNGRPRFQHFCAECGSPLFTSGEGGPDDWGIRWGSIRQRGQLRPVRQIWCRSAVSWINDLAGLPGRPGD